MSVKCCCCRLDSHQGSATANKVHRWTAFGIQCFGLNTHPTAALPGVNINHFHAKSFSPANSKFKITSNFAALASFNETCERSRGANLGTQKALNSTFVSETYLQMGIRSCMQTVHNSCRSRQLSVCTHTEQRWPQGDFWALCRNSRYITDLLFICGRNLQISKYIKLVRCEVEVNANGVDAEELWKVLNGVVYGFVHFPINCELCWDVGGIAFEFALVK